MYDLNGKKVLVTGAGGFVGSHLCARLIKLGAKVTALTHYNSRSSYANLEFLKNKEIECLNIIKGNIEDPYFIDYASENIEIIFHLAALIGIPYSYVSPLSYVKTNIEGTINLLEASKKRNIKMIHTSTSECYGTAIYTPINESHPLQGQSPYSASKISADKIVESYYNSFGINVTTIRPFNVFGPGQSARAIIPTIISQLIKSNNVKVGSTSPIRDFTYVDDTVHAFIKAAQNEKISGDLINIGNGKGISIKDLILKCAEILKIENLKIISTKERSRPEKSEVFNLICDNTRAKDTIDWSPSVSLIEGLEKTALFIKKHQDFYKIGKYEV